MLCYRCIYLITELAFNPTKFKFTGSNTLVNSDQPLQGLEVPITLLLRYFRQTFCTKYHYRAVEFHNY